MALTCHVLVSDFIHRTVGILNNLNRLNRVGRQREGGGCTVSDRDDMTTDLAVQSFYWSLNDTLSNLSVQRLLDDRK
jgi:hypothetical protein